MGAITVRMTDNMLAYVQEQAGHEGYPDAEAFLQALVMDHHARTAVALQAMLEEGLASGVSSKSIDDVFEDARQRYRARQA